MLGFVKSSAKLMDRWGSQDLINVCMPGQPCQNLNKQDTCLIMAVAGSGNGIETVITMILATT